MQRRFAHNGLKCARVVPLLLLFSAGSEFSGHELRASFLLGYLGRILGRETLQRRLFNQLWKVGRLCDAVGWELEVPHLSFFHVNLTFR